MRLTLLLYLFLIFILATESRRKFKAMQLSWEGGDYPDTIYQPLMGTYAYDDKEGVFKCKRFRNCLIKPTDQNGSVWRLNLGSNQGYLLLSCYNGGSLINRNRVTLVKNGKYEAEPLITVDFIAIEEKARTVPKHNNDWYGWDTKRKEPFKPEPTPKPWWNKNQKIADQEWWTNMHSTQWETVGTGLRHSPYYNTYRQMDKSIDKYGYAQHVGKINRGTYINPELRSPGRRTFGHNSDFNPQDFSSGAFSSPPQVQNVLAEKPHVDRGLVANVGDRVPLTHGHQFRELSNGTITLQTNPDHKDPCSPDPCRGIFPAGVRARCKKIGHNQVNCEPMSMLPPVQTKFERVENGQVVVQTNSYQQQTGVLELTLPAHKDYKDSTFVFEEASNTAMLKTDDICQLSSLNLPEGMSVEAAAKAFEKNVPLEPKTEFFLKERKATLGKQKRSEVLSNVQDKCANTPLVETFDREVSNSDFEDFLAGNVVLVGQPKSDGNCVDIEVSACSKVGPRACGNMAFVPPGQSRGFSFHQVSEGSVCVSCHDYKELPAGQTPCNKKDLCDCSDIRDKISLYDCSIKDTESFIQILSSQGGTSFISQEMLYDMSNIRRSIKFISPSHNGLKETHIVMHAHNDGYWHNWHLKLNMMIKIDTQCFIETLQQDVFPYDIATGIQDIKNGNVFTAKNDEILEYKVLMDNGPLSSNEESGLHPNINEICSDLGIAPRKFQRRSVTKEQSNKLMNGETIYFDSDQNFKTVAISKDGNSGSWRYPRTEGDEIWTNQILHSVVTATCCEGRTCTNPGCECKDIVDQESFKRCLCADGWTKFGGRCYKLFEHGLPWEEAEETCQGWWAGAHLASIHSAEEQVFIQQNFPKNIWLGGSDREREGHWAWSDGSKWGYEGWHPREPNNHKGQQHCLSGNWGKGGVKLWDDYWCHKQRRFLCKY